MRCPPALALLFLGLALPGSAQRGAAHGGFSGHAAPAFHGPGPSFRGSAHPSYATAYAPRPNSASRLARSPRYGTAYAPRYATGSFRGAPTAYARIPSAARPAFYTRTRNPYDPGHDRHRRFGYPGLAYPLYLGYGIGYPFWDNGFDPFWDYPDTFDTGTAQPPDQAAAPYPQQPPPDTPPYPPEAPPAPWPPAPAPPQELAQEDAVTLIFKDGRPPEQIRNYALTSTALYVPGKHIREIPLDQLDLPAIARVNHDAGVDFQPPHAK